MQYQNTYLKQLLLVTLLSICKIAESQNDSHLTTLDLYLTNIEDHYLEILFYSGDGGIRIDTMHRLPTGIYHYRNFEIKDPQSIIIVGSHINIQNILVAPGYNLKITGNASDFYTLQKTLEISGLGSESNAYPIFINSLQSVSFCKDLAQISELEAIRCLSNYRHVRDSAAIRIFIKHNSGDIYQSRFGKQALIDNEFLFISSIFQFAKVNNYSINALTQLLGSNTRVLNYYDAP